MDEPAHWEGFSSVDGEDGEGGDGDGEEKAWWTWKQEKKLKDNMINIGPWTVDHGWSSEVHSSEWFQSRARLVP